MTDADLICVGGGLGGLAAAIRAHDLGAKVIVIERSPMVGGVAAYSGGWVWVGANHLAQAAEIDDSVESTERYLDYVQGEGRPVDRPARRRYLETAIEATEWYANAGIPFSLVRGAPDLFHPAPGSSDDGRALECSLPGSDLGAWRERLRQGPHYRTGLTRDEIYRGSGTGVEERIRLAEQRRTTDFLTHGMGLAAAFVREALVRRDVECLLEHRVVRLIQENGRVTGVVAEGPGGERVLRARRGVLLATGGYGNGPDAADLEEVPELVESAPPVVDGDHLSLAQDVGATVVRGADPFIVLGARFQAETHPGTSVPLYRPVLENVGFPHSMIVNRDGCRFGDESYYGSLITGVRQYDSRRKRWRNYPCWFIADEDFRTRYPLGPFDPGDPYSDEIVRADSIEELADLLGIDRAGLVATVTGYNDAALRGEDPEHGRGTLPFARQAYGDPDCQPNPNLGPIGKPPFYGLPLTVLGVGLCTLGLGIDAHARVLRRDGTPVDGLYATGNAAATRELKGYVTGLANARNYAYAFAGATHAMTTG